MDRISIKYVFDRKNEATASTKQGLLQIEVRLTGTSKRVYISTGIKLYKNQFSSKDGFTCKNHPNAPSITYKARDVFYKVQAFTYSERCRHLEDVKLWNMPEGHGESWTAFMEKEIGIDSIKKVSIGTELCVLRWINKWGLFRTFADVTYDNLRAFDLFLKKQKLSLATIALYHNNLRKFTARAVRQRIITYDPYSDFQIESHRGKTPTYLTIEEVERIKRADISGKPKSYRLVRNLFLFQCYTGLAYIDTQLFTPDKIELIDGRKVIRSNRKKTDQNFVLLLLPEAEAILEEHGYQPPRIVKTHYNIILKRIAELAGIDKHLTSHVGRHTFATYLLNKKVPIESVSRAMGHANISQTQHYARLMARTVIADMAKLVDDTPEKNENF